MREHETYLMVLKIIFKKKTRFALLSENTAWKKLKIKQINNRLVLCPSLFFAKRKAQILLTERRINRPRRRPSPFLFPDQSFSTANIKMPCLHLLNRTFSDSERISAKLKVLDLFNFSFYIYFQLLILIFVVDASH